MAKKYSNRKNLYLKSSTVSTLQPQALAATNGSVTNSVALQGLHTKVEKALTALQQQRAAGTNVDFATAATEE